MARSSFSRISNHSMIRARQRGYRVGDLEKVEQLGTPVKDGILLRSRDIASEIQRLTDKRRKLRARSGLRRSGDQTPIRMEEASIRKEIEQLQRLQGTFIPVQGGCALTVYRPSRRRLRRILHR